MGTQYPYRKPYKVAKTLWKVAKSIGVLGSGAASTIAFPEPGDGVVQWVVFAATLTPPIATGIGNYLKNREKW